MDGHEWTEFDKKMALDTYKGASPEDVLYQIRRDGKDIINLEKYKPYPEIVRFKTAIASARDSYLENGKLTNQQIEEADKEYLKAKAMDTFEIIGRYGILKENDIYLDEQINELEYGISEGLFDIEGIRSQLTNYETQQLERVEEFRKERQNKIQESRKRFNDLASRFSKKE